MRTFVAFDVPKELLIDLRDSLDVTGVKIVEDFHCTLKFLGDIAPGKVDWVKSQLKNVSFRPFEVRLSKVGAFPNAKEPKVFWVGLEPVSEIAFLQGGVDGSLNKHFSKNVKFKAHVTLGRVKDYVERKAIDSFLKQKPSGKFLLDKFKLYSSELKSEGPIHTMLENYSSYS